MTLSFKFTIQNLAKEKVVELEADLKQMLIDLFKQYTPEDIKVLSNVY